MKLSLPVRTPFSLHSVMHSHGWIQLAPFEADPDGAGFRTILCLDSGRVVELHFAEEQGQVLVTPDTPLTEDELVEVHTRAAWMLGLEQDFSEFYALAAGEPKLQHVVERARGRILRSPTLFEDVVKTILTTNTLWAATRRMNLNLVNQFGDPLPADPSRRAFPRPEALAAASEEILRRETRLGYRAPYVLDLARRTASGELDLEALKDADLPTPELRKRLMAIKGVGAYAAANLLMLLGRYDFIPLDSWALKMVSLEWFGGERVTPAQVEAAFEQWGKWKGLVYWMWDWSHQG
ncbi:MAG: DNA-3-methyladenine glycosylase 2 family protein [Chloroflexi bacterium]|jgi:3-methyladenine DNA glycosylase/8-oxoguanine DNA glycosylase|nr:DNA-3-methyladenine glycosylase 2 family protein [Chloroflexota bacterium]